MKPIIRSYLIEVNLGATVPGAGSQVYINDYPTLRNVFLYGVMAHSATTLAVSPSGKSAITAAGERSITLTLVDKFNMEIIHNYPIYDLDPINVSGFYRDYQPFPLQLTKSYITINTTSNLSANQSVLLNILYSPEPPQNAPTQNRLRPRRRQ
jgi:hypothetical protein